MLESPIYILNFHSDYLGRHTFLDWSRAIRFKMNLKERATPLPRAPVLLLLRKSSTRRWVGKGGGYRNGKTFLSWPVEATDTYVRARTVAAYRRHTLDDSGPNKFANRMRRDDRALRGLERARRSLARDYTTNPPLPLLSLTYNNNTDDSWDEGERASSDVIILDEDERAAPRLLSLYLLVYSNPLLPRHPLASPTSFRARSLPRKSLRAESLNPLTPDTR